MALEISDFIVPGKRAHLIGIGGVSMCPLAHVLFDMGLMVSGSDIQASDGVESLKKLGIDVEAGHRAENIEGADFIIRTAAAKDDNVEVAAARKAGIPVFERAQAWGHIMRSYKNALCIAGTHGKTTTSSMAAHILMEAGLDPTVMIGGTLPLLGGAYRVGSGDTIILESCEYKNSFLSFSPTVAVILNVDADHLDFFRDIDDVSASFRRFASLVPPNGRIAVNADDERAMAAVRPLGRELLTFGLGKDAAVRGENIRFKRGLPSFDVYYSGEFFCHVELTVPGGHNVTDALAATAAAIALGISAPAIVAGLSTFRGANRRFEYKGTFNGADIYDDYAHHPNELRALLDAAEKMDYKRIICVFQPHTYTRTKALFDDFAAQLRRPDVVLLAEIYAAREKNTIGISSRDLAGAVDGALFFPTLGAIAEHIKNIARPGDLILTVGAGDICLVGNILTGRIQG